MTDKALEAAARALFLVDYPKDDWGRFGPDDYHPNKYRAKASAAISAYLSALPEVAEVVMEQIAHKEQIGIWANELTSALSLSNFLREDWSFDDSVDLENEVAAQLLDIIRSAITHPGMNLVASLQAMQARAEKAEQSNKALMAERASLIETKRQQIDRLELSRGAASKVALDAIARAEKAERERDEYEEPALSCPHLDAFIAKAQPPQEVLSDIDAVRNINSQLRYGTWHYKAIADDLKARVKELEEAFRDQEPAIEHIETLTELLKVIKKHWIDYDHVFSIAVHEADDFVARYRTALKGGSNG